MIFHFVLAFFFLRLFRRSPVWLLYLFRFIHIYGFLYDWRSDPSLVSKLDSPLKILNWTLFLRFNSSKLNLGLKDPIRWQDPTNALRFLPRLTLICNSENSVYQDPTYGRKGFDSMWGYLTRIRFFYPYSGCDRITHQSSDSSYDGYFTPHTVFTSRLPSVVVDPLKPTLCHLPW